MLRIYLLSSPDLPTIVLDLPTVISWFTYRHLGLTYRHLRFTYHHFWAWGAFGWEALLGSFWAGGFFWGAYVHTPLNTFTYLSIFTITLHGKHIMNLLLLLNISLSSATN